jgi:hypothetical protein
MLRDDWSLSEQAKLESDVAKPGADFKRDR